jgi:preprotein translocase subunit SecF
MQENKEAVDENRNRYMEGVTSQSINLMIRTMMMTMTTLSVILMLGVVQLLRGVSENMEGKV